MREGIHPDYYQAKVVCNCGNEFVTGSTNESIHVEICSKCHPFYTGQQKATQARGRVDKLKKYMETDEYAEEVAREKLGLVKDNETVFKKQQ